MLQHLVLIENFLQQNDNDFGIIEKKEGKRIKMKKIKVFEGHLFIVPLNDKEFCIGLVTRYYRRRMLAYFFKPKWYKIPTLEEVEPIKEENTILIAKAGAEPIIDGEWPIIGKLSNWDKEKWSVPTLYTLSVGTPNAYLVYTNDKDPFLIDRTVECLRKDAYKYFPDTYYGLGTIPSDLIRLFNGESIYKISFEGIE